MCVPSVQDLGLPAVAVKTGFSHKRDNLRNVGDPTLAYCVDLVSSGLPTVFLDVRRRPLLGVALSAEATGAANRTNLIEAAKVAYATWCDALRAEGLADTFDACTLAHFHDVINGDGDHRTIEITGGASAEAGGVQLWRAIQLLRMQEQVLQAADGNTGSEDGKSLLVGLRSARTLREVEAQLAAVAAAGEHVQVPPGLEHLWQSMSGLNQRRTSRDAAASAAGRSSRAPARVAPPSAPTSRTMTRASMAQVHQLASWLSHRYFADAFAMLPEEARGGHADAASMFKEQIYVHTLCSRMLLTSASFYHINLCDPYEADRLMGRLVKLDRLPRQNPLEGLLLLDKAWKDHDVRTCTQASTHTLASVLPLLILCKSLRAAVPYDLC